MRENTSADLLLDAIVEKDAPVVVGLDPMLSYIPEFILKESFARFGETLEGAADAVRTFNHGLVDALCDIVPAVKPQIAMYEQFGVPGLEAFSDTVSYCKSKGLLVLGDIKRGDIGSTSGAYATAHLGKIAVGSAEISPFDEDFVTVNPYLGTDGVKPFMDVCASEGKGIFVLVKTSNPSSGEFQDVLAPDVPLYELVARKVDEWGAELMCSRYSYSNVGAVVGATYPQIAKDLRGVMPRAIILVPGYGAQGGTAADIAGNFGPDGLGAIVNSSRGIICAWKKSGDEKGYAEAARQAVLDMIEDINSVR